MESHEQGLLLADDTPLNYDANYCGLQSEVQMQFDSTALTGFPVTHEPSAEGSSMLHGSGMNMVELGGNVTRDDNSVLENGREPVGGSDERCIVSSDDSGLTGLAEAVGNAITAGVCIGTIVSMNTPGNTGLPKQFTDEAARARKVQLTASCSKPESRIDYGESLAMEDFGGEFEDGHGTEESPFASVNVFTDSVTDKSDTINAPPAEAEKNFESAQIPASEAQNGDVDTGPEEQLDLPESLDRILPKSPGETSPEHEEEEPPTLEREVLSQDLNSEQNEGEEDGGDAENPSSQMSSRGSRRQGEAVSGRKPSSDTEELPSSNLELNVNSRPRRSVNRKSVFELLHVDYRYVGGPKKVGAHRASDGEVNHEPPVKKQKSSKKTTKASNERQERSPNRPVKKKRILPVKRDHIHDIDDQINALKKKVVGYQPDDFFDDNVESDVMKDAQGTGMKSTSDADRRSLKESMFAETDDLAARSFLSTFAAESAEALSSSKQEGDISNKLDALTAENHKLRSRIKALEQSRILTKKFNIDFHGRKFSRIRSFAVASPDPEKTPGKVIGGSHDSTPSTERKAPVEAAESVLSRLAVLDRREHKLRELSAELDERATSVKIAEGALHRRERKLVDFEKTLEHRERLLSRHEQSILKRELMLGSPALPAGEPPVEDGEDRQSLAAEMQRRLEQRRQELDRRQTAIDSERTRLEMRERELDRRVAEESLSSAVNDGDGRAEKLDRNSNVPSKRLTSVGNQKKKASVSHSIRSKYLAPKKQKVLLAF